jgi:hypothetical protein
MIVRDKLECLSLACISILVKSLWVRAEPTRFTHRSGALLKGRLLPLPKNIRLDWKGLPRTSTPAYYEHSLNYGLKKSYNIGLTA